MSGRWRGKGFSLVLLRYYSPFLPSPLRVITLANTLIASPSRRIQQLLQALMRATKAVRLSLRDTMRQHFKSTLFIVVTLMFLCFAIWQLIPFKDILVKDAALLNLLSSFLLLGVTALYVGLTRQILKTSLAQAREAFRPHVVGIARLTTSGISAFQSRLSRTKVHERQRLDGEDIILERTTKIYFDIELENIGRGPMINAKIGRAHV